jgi:hypothetical protein
LLDCSEAELDWVQFRTVGWKVKELYPSCIAKLSDPVTSMSGSVVANKDGIEVRVPIHSRELKRRKSVPKTPGRVKK